MNKVYIVWFINENGKASIWGIYADEDRAAEMVANAEENFGYKAWYNDEWVL